MALPYLPNATVILKDVRVPKENLIGRLNLSFIVAIKTLELGRILTAAGAVGLMERALTESIRYSKSGFKEDNLFQTIRLSNCI